MLLFHLTPRAITTSEGLIWEQSDFHKWSDCRQDCLMGKLGAMGAGDGTALSRSSTPTPNNL